MIAATPRRYELTDNSAHDWHVRTRAGMPFELQIWGAGFQCVAGDLPSYFATRDAAVAAGERWVELGVTRFTLWGRDVSRDEFLAAHPELLAPALELAA